jgi:AraC-like DNA-binding protein
LGLEFLCLESLIRLSFVQREMDPFVDLIRLLRPRATLWRTIEACGRWGISFHKRNDLLFCWVEKGECLLQRPKVAALKLRAGDFALVRTSSSFDLTSDAKVKSIDSEKAFASQSTIALKLGAGKARSSTLHGGRFVFDTANEEILTGLLPQLVHIRATDRSMRRIHQLLKMNATESANRRPGYEFVVARLMELILIEVLRREGLNTERTLPGLLAGLSDAVVAPALNAIHDDVAHDWTVAGLASLANISRSAFASRFREVVGTGPIEYLKNWRIAVAKDELREGVKSSSEIAFAVGFQSVSAFSTSFSRRVGCSPKAFTNRLRIATIRAN